MLLTELHQRPALGLRYVFVGKGRRKLYLLFVGLNKLTLIPNVQADAFARHSDNNITTSAWFVVGSLQPHAARFADA